MMRQVHYVYLSAIQYFHFAVGCLAAAVNGGIQPVFAILFSEILGVFSGNQDPATQEADVRLYSLLFVAIGGAAFLANFFQV